MTDNFFDLSKKQQTEIIEATSNQLSLSTAVIEKDLWVCWTLEKLFELPITMAFKGGTSLSKCYNLIQRFSEDIDITLDYHYFLPQIDIKNQSKSALKRISEQLKQQVIEQVRTTIYPHLYKCLQIQNIQNESTLQINEEGDQIYFYYPSTTKDKYLKDHVLIEFGGRNSTKPNETIKIETFISSLTNKLNLPSPEISVLSPIRTFWEKATLIHVECHRGRLNLYSNRLSRHWYDLAMLTINKLDDKALNDKVTFGDVMQHKIAFYNASYANYDKCLEGRFKLLPSNEEISALQSDYKLMIDSGMFSIEPISFDKIIKIILELQSKINNLYSTQ